MVHRDVKPSNILVDEEDFAYLIDFGIARAVGESKLTATGNVIGTWAYMAPERLTSGQTDPRADIYALTCVLHECLTGSQPFPGNSVEQQITAHLTLPPPRPSVLCDTVPTAIDAVIAKGMAKNSGERYATTREMANAARAAITLPMNQSRLPTEPARYVDHETEHAAQPPMPPIHHAATIAGVSPSAPTRYRPGSDPHAYPPTPGIPGGVLPPKPKRRYRTAIAIAGAIGVGGRGPVIGLQALAPAATSQSNAKGRESAHRSSTFHIWIDRKALAYSPFPLLTEVTYSERALFLSGLPMV